MSLTSKKLISKTYQPIYPFFFNAEKKEKKKKKLSEIIPLSKSDFFLIIIKKILDFSIVREKKLG